MQVVHLVLRQLKSLAASRSFGFLVPRSCCGRQKDEVTARSPTVWAGPRLQSASGYGLCPSTRSAAHTTLGRAMIIYSTLCGPPSSYLVAEAPRVQRGTVTEMKCKSSLLAVPVKLTVCSLIVSESPRSLLQFHHPAMPRDRGAARSSKLFKVMEEIYLVSR
jgi:hypothetical protein